jgi:hypothetical protein
MSTHTLPLSEPRNWFTDNGERLLPVSVVASRLNRTPRMIRYLIQGGRLAAVRKGKLLFCQESAVECYRKPKSGVSR